MEKKQIAKSDLNLADELLEQGRFEEAQHHYQSLGLYAQAGFAAILNQDLDLAFKLYQEAPLSPAKRWGLFLYDFFSNPNRSIPSPGFLSCRLFFEATMGYIFKFEIKEWRQIIIKNKESLKVIYPDLEKELKRAETLSC